MIDRMNEALAGRYRVEALAGRGGMATVYRAVDLRHDRLVAIKVMNPEFVESVGRDRFLREIRVTAGLSHPHLLALYDSGAIDDTLFYVMPFVDGVSLRQRLEKEKQLPTDDVIRIVRETADALSYAHAHGVVHRDIKPENILLAGYAPDDPRRRWNVLVGDFGVSTLTVGGNDHLTATGMAVGSPLYMSPEQASGESVDARADIWALGCVAFEMLEGRAPRGVLDFSRRDLPPSVTAAITRAVSTEPAKRFGDAMDFADAITARPSRPRRGKWWIGGVAAALVVGATAATLHWRPVLHARVVTRDSLALALYNRGRVMQGTRNVPGIRQAFDDFSAAVARDSGFASAWSGVARAAQMALLRGVTIKDLSPDSLLAIALIASQRALTIDSTTADVWVTRARVLESVDPTSRDAVLSDLRHALSIDSTNGEAWYLVGRAREELLDSSAARVAYAKAVHYAPRNAEALSFLAFHSMWTGQPAAGVQWADSAVAVEPTSALAREAAALIALDLRDWPAADRQLTAARQVAVGADATGALAHAARAAAARGDLAIARRLAAQAEQTVGSAGFTKHQAATLGEAFSAAGDTARAVRWLSAFSPRADVHYQLHLHRDPGLRWLRDPRYAWLLVVPPAVKN
jgi:serine/threonine protein kinase